MQASRDTSFNMNLDGSDMVPKLMSDIAKLATNQNG